MNGPIIAGIWQTLYVTIINEQVNEQFMKINTFIRYSYSTSQTKQRVKRHDVKNDVKRSKDPKQSLPTQTKVLK